MTYGESHDRKREQKDKERSLRARRCTARCATSRGHATPLEEARSSGADIGFSDVPRDNVQACRRADRRRSFTERHESHRQAPTRVTGIGFTRKASVASRLWGIKDRCILHSPGSWTSFSSIRTYLDTYCVRKKASPLCSLCLRTSLRSSGS
ncbi:hypothetical protein G5I_10397 [Acromyrmex echinatior]|uniref:Uncharacterized protein n=1 Tax=Acromyrmex echinatior TaxID=103372 RepID=F4WWS7_ACREC|nr:hypothetical protein G5I_10397 [Acromyrmex echinatior]